MFFQIHVFKTLFQLLHFSIFLHARKTISNINFHALKFSCEHWVLCPKNKTPQKKKHKSKLILPLILVIFFLNLVILVCTFVAHNYAFCPRTCQNWLISPPNRGTLQITLMQNKYMLPKHKMARRKKKFYWIFSQNLHI
jgi:hypothetical protein